MTVWREASNRFIFYCMGFFAVFFLLKWESPPATGEIEKGGVASDARVRRYFSLPFVLPHV
jgi:hypothetical protein